MYVQYEQTMVLGPTARTTLRYIRKVTLTSAMPASSRLGQLSRALHTEAKDGVEFREADGGLRQITLARPKALNALNLDMVRAITPKVVAWNTDPSTSVILMDGAGDKAFCAGGDVVDVAKSGRGGPDGKGTDGGQLSRDFFREEYILDHMLARLSKPYVALIDGITMGGGVGISLPADFRVATERTLYAMPETAIGLFPDVGGSFYLSRLQGQLGMYLALTGARLKGEDLLRAGIATHYIESKNLTSLISELESLSVDSSTDDVKAILDKFDNSTGAPASFEANIEEINEVFGAQSLDDLIQQLENLDSDWARKQLATIKSMSPTSLHLTFKQLRLGASMSLEDCFQMEYRMTQGCMRGVDFYEGIRALLIDKDKNPKWDPATIDEVPAETIEDHFKPLENDLVLDENTL